MRYRAYLTKLRLHGSPHVHVKILRVRMKIRGPDTMATPSQAGAAISEEVFERKAIVH